jgi:hypothetical protein
VSGTSITFGAKSVYNSSQSEYNQIAFVPGTTNKFLLSYNDSALIGTLSGTTLTYGSPTAYYSGTHAFASLSVDEASGNKFVIAYRDQSNSSQGAVVSGTISGNTVSFGSPTVFTPDFTTNTVVAFDPNTAGNFVVVYKDVDNSDSGTGVLGQVVSTALVSNITSTNFLGTSQAAYTNAQTATIMLQGGISTNQTGLTIGSTYYVQPDGSLSTTESSPSVIAGKALSTTALFLANWSDVYTDPNLLVKTADLTVYAGDSIVAGAGGITITLPSSPSIGDSVIIKDGTGVVSVTPFTVAGNGSNIVSSASSLTFNSNWAEVRFVFIDATIGWSV